MPTRVAVFGSSEIRPGEPAWKDAESTGRLVVQAGFEVVSGGYGGVMEAASKGAAEAGGTAIGVTCEEFGRGSGNSWLTEERPAPNLFERTRVLIDLSSAYIILPGKAGTLAELAFLWALLRGGILHQVPLVLLGAFWSGFVKDLLERGLLELSQAEVTSHAATPEEAVAIILRQVTPS